MFTLAPPTGGPVTAQLSTMQWALPHAGVNVQAGTGRWQLAVTSQMLAALAVKQPALCTTVTIDSVHHVHLNPAAIDDLWIVCNYDYK